APKPKIDKDQPEYYKDQLIHDDMMIPPASSFKDEAIQFIKWYATEGYDPMVANGRPPLYKKFDSAKAAELLLIGAEDLIDTKSFIENVLTPSEHTVQNIAVRQAAELDTIFREEQEAYYLNIIGLDEMLDNLQKR